jgi:hypothetical protein
MVPDRQNLDQNNPEQQPNVSLNNNSDQISKFHYTIILMPGNKGLEKIFQ